MTAYAETTHLHLVNSNFLGIRKTGRLPALEDGLAFVVCRSDNGSVKE